MSLTGIAFLLAYTTGLALALFRHPRFGLYTYLAVFFLNPPSRWWGVLLPDLRWALVAAVVTLVATVRLPARAGAARWTSTAPAVLLIVFTVWLWIQNLWALSPSEHLEMSILFTKYIVLYYLLFRLLDSPQEVGNFLLAHVIGCAYLSWLVYLAPEVGGGRVEGIGGPGIDDANSLGMFISTGVLCAGMLILAENSWRRWICVLAMPFLLNTVVQSGSRGATIGSIAAAVTVIYLAHGGLRAKLFLLGTVGLVLAAAFVPSNFWERMLTLRAVTDERVEMDTSAESRFVLAEAQLRMAADHPLGTGHRGTAVLSPQYLEERWLTKRRGDDPLSAGARSSHNTFLSALVEHSVAGLIIFVGLALWLIRTILAVKRLGRSGTARSDRELLYATGAAASLVVVFVAGQFTDYIKTEVQIWMFALLAALLALRAPRPQKAQTESVGQAAEASAVMPLGR